MYNITLIGTRHVVLGKCNLDELYQIVERINPEVIFEEIPPSHLGLYHINKFRSSLESETINKYLENHEIKCVPVDSEDIPSESFFQKYKYVLEQIEGLKDVNGSDYRNFTDRYKMQVEMHGFKYLNSIYCINDIDKINNAIKGGCKK